MYMNFFISCVKGSVYTNSVDLVLSFLSVKIGLISYHFVPQHEVIKYFFFFWINIILIEHLIHLKLKTLDQQYANVKRLQTEDFNICIVFLRELLLFDDLTCIKIDHSQTAHRLKFIIMQDRTILYHYIYRSQTKCLMLQEHIEKKPQNSLPQRKTSKDDC